MEEWKVIEDSDGHYYISSYGRMKREEYDFISTRGTEFHRDYKNYGYGKFNENNGYLSFSYRGKNGKSNTELAHRLVAKTFIKNPEPLDYDQVNHIDGNKTNNHIENLEWCNRSQNMLHASQHGLINRDSEKRKKQAPLNGKKGAWKQYIPTAEYDENGNLLTIHEHCDNIECFRLTYHNHFFRQVPILKEKFGEVPNKIDIDRIVSVTNKRRKIYIATLPNGEQKYYYKLSELPISRERLWFFFGHGIPDFNGVKWDIQNNEYQGKFSKEFRAKALTYLETHTYDETAEKFGINKSSLTVWKRKTKLYN